MKIFLVIVIVAAASAAGYFTYKSFSAKAGKKVKSANAIDEPLPPATQRLAV